MAWATIWSAISAVGAVLTVATAVWAVLRWKKQDELKAKLAFKMGIAEYLQRLMVFGIYIKPALVDRDIDRIGKLNEAFSACSSYWLVSEGLMENNAIVKEGWDYISKNHGKFIAGSFESADLKMHCELILKQKFVFK